MNVPDPAAFLDLEPKSPAGGFDRVAWCYDALAGLVFGSALHRAQRAALAGLPPGAPRVLILGGGTGWVLLEVLRLRPQATVLYVEASAEMLARSMARLRKHLPQCAGQVTFRLGTHETLAVGEAFDAIVTFFVLDCLEPTTFKPALQRLAAVARPGAVWLIADFQPARTGWQRALLALMYRFFRLTTGLLTKMLPDWPTALAAGRWQAVGETAEFYGASVLAGAYSRITQ